LLRPPNTVTGMVPLTGTCYILWVLWTIFFMFSLITSLYSCVKRKSFGNSKGNIANMANNQLINKELYQYEIIPAYHQPDLILSRRPTRHERRELTCSYIGIAAWIHTSILTCQNGGKSYCRHTSKKPYFYADMTVCWHGNKTQSLHANKPT
jgi:hypothetical protein